MSTQQLPTVPPILWDREALGPLGTGTLVVTSPSAYLAAENAGLALGSAEVVFARDVDAHSASGVNRVLTLGSGATIDVAKIAAHQAELPLRVAPTVLSTDAPFSTVAAVRPRGVVEYVETGTPQAVVLDAGLLEQAPWSAHLKGLGDVLAIESAIRDWVSRSPREGTPERAAARALVDTVLDSSSLWSSPSRQGLETLSDLLRLKVHLGLHVGSPWLEEGTEHYLAYALEPHLRYRVWHGDVLFRMHCAGSEVPDVPTVLTDTAWRTDWHLPQTLRCPAWPRLAEWAWQLLHSCEEPLGSQLTQWVHVLRESPQPPALDVETEEWRRIAREVVSPA